MSDVVLLHGAGTGGWLRDDVAARLRGHSCVVHAPSLVGVGTRIDEGGPDTDLTTHVRQVAELLEPLREVVLVGFSYGGLVAGVVAARDPRRVRRLVYVDGFVPQPGRSMLEVLPAEVAATMTRLAEDHGDGWRIPPMPVEQLGGLGRPGQGVDPAGVAAAMARRGPHPLGTYREPAPPEAPFPAGRASYLLCTDKAEGDPMTAIAAAVERAGGAVHRLSAGHFAMLTAPDELTALLQQAAALD